MTLKGGCYCGGVRYVVEGEPTLRAQCHCRECQYITGGGPNYFMMVPADGFSFVEGRPKSFTRSDLERPVTRLFCPECGTHLATRLPELPMLVLKVGTLDDPSQYAGPQMAIFTADKQPFHVVPDTLPAFARSPG
jgi:hypothetical protein